ncbi:MAG: mechanosensitive ion channel family protein [Lentisphaeria bacterium]|nr:mechanosensitive ion channel family protein [Lentisphaeria bacterium]
MRKLTLKRLLGPTIIFLLFILVGFNTENVLRQFGLEALNQTRQVFDYGLQIGLWLSAAFFINRLITVFFWDGLIARTVQGRIPRLLKDITACLLYVIAATGIVAVVFDRPVTGFWATSGAMGIVLGFALRNIILDVFTGLAVNVDRPYTIGDWIMIVDNPGAGEDLIGCVEEINWRTTRLRTTDNNMLMVPNNIMGQKVVTNFMTPGEESRFDLDFTLDFSVPSDRALRVLNAAVKAVAGEHEGPLLSPAPKARITGITNSGVEYRLRYWILPRLVSPPKARHTVISSVLQHLHQSGMTLAYPKQDTYVASMPKRQHQPAMLEDRGVLLSRIGWFKALTAGEIHTLAEALLPREFPQGATLLVEGERSNSMFVVVEGLLEMSASSSQSGDEVKVGKLVPGDFYGEMGLLTDEASPACVKAATSVIAYEITKEDLLPVLEARPEAMAAISCIVAQRQVAAEHAMLEAAAPQIEERTQSVSGAILRKMKHVFSSVFGGSSGQVLEPHIHNGSGAGAVT